ncbi:MAG: sulfatase-like hydrolase/transferase, partial [bacterium]|nr:sulfatase-like hydrolase/transferase [bacterium]
YATGVFGKWHVGIEPEYHPLERGFDTFYGFLGHGAHDYFKLQRSSSHNSIYRDREIIDDTGYLTDNLAREATAFIEGNRRRPFFLYLPFNAVHWPLQAPAEDIKQFSSGNENRDVYLAMLHRMDLAVGAVLDTLGKHGLTENTLVIFFSDNGGAQKNHANNGRLRDYKQSVYEGGIRVPFLMSWPARIPKGVVNDEPVISLDAFPTICAATGAKLPSDRVYDGKNILPILSGEAKGPLHEALFWDGDQRRQAVRAGKWKMVNNRDVIELYDLEADPGETRNLFDHHPDVLKRLRRLFNEWRSEMAPRLQ